MVLVGLVTALALVALLDLAGLVMFLAADDLLVFALGVVFFLVAMR